jgi:hypothetical protein
MSTIMTVRKKSAQGELDLPAPSGDLTQARYVNARGHVCPKCSSSVLKGGDLVALDGIIHRDVQCLDCKSQWVEQFAITAFANFRNGVNDKAARRKARRLARKGKKT